MFRSHLLNYLCKHDDVFCSCRDFLPAWDLKRGDVNISTEFPLVFFQRILQSNAYKVEQGFIMFFTTQQRVGYFILTLKLKYTSELLVKYE